MNPKHYAFRPCRVCGDIRRYVAGDACVTCTIRRTGTWARANKDKRKPVWDRSNRKRQGLPEPTRAAPTACECCAGPPGKRALHLDHCHETGKFRGWLCTGCNTAIGRLGDNVAGVQRAINYLKENG